MATPDWKKKVKQEPDAPKYSDHAKEQGEDQSPDYEPTKLASSMQ